MGWNISPRPGGGDLRRSYTSVHNLGQQLAHVLPARQWRVIAGLFNRGSGDPFTIRPKDAGVIAAVFRAAADHPKMPADWGNEAMQFALSARQAANSRQSWEWR